MRSPVSKHWLFRVVLAVGALLASAAPAVARQVDDGPQASIELAERSPWVSDSAPVTLDVAITGDTAGTTMRVRIHPPLRDADDLETSLTEDVGGITRSIDLGPTDDIAVSPAGNRQIVITGDEMRSPGVHPVVVELRSGDGEVLGLVRTPVIRLGTDDSPLDAPKLSIVVDVGIDPTVGPQGRREPTSTEIGRLERTAAFLDELAQLDPPTPVTVLAVPDTLDSLALSSDPRAPDLLDRISAAVGPDPVAMPLVPVSAAALEAAGLGDALGSVIDAGVASLTDRFGDVSPPSIWTDGDVTPAAAALLAERGFETILTDTVDDDQPGSNDSRDSERLLEPAGPRPIPALDDSEVSAVVADLATTEALTAGVGDRVDVVPLAIAELILRDDRRGSDVVLRVDEVSDDSLLVAALPLLTAVDAPVEIVPLPGGRSSRDPDEEDLPDPVTLPTGAGTDLTPIAEQYRSVERDVVTFDAFAGADSSRAADLAEQRLTSVADGLETADRLALLEAVEAVVAEGFDGIDLTGQTDLNLTSREGDLPIAIANANDYPVRVTVVIRSDRLRFPDGEEFEVIAEPDITRLDVRVEALATGSVPTFVEIRTPDGALVLDARQLNVRSTAVSGVGLALSLGALAVLAVWWIRTWRKKHKTDDTGEIGME